MKIPFVRHTTLHEEVWQHYVPIEDCRSYTCMAYWPLQNRIPGYRNIRIWLPLDTLSHPRWTEFSGTWQSKNKHIYVLTCTFLQQISHLNTLYVFPLQFSPAVSVLNIIINKNIKNNGTKWRLYNTYYCTNTYISRKSKS